MAITDFFKTRFEDFYANPDFVAVIFSLLVFMLVFSALNKFVFPKNRGVNIIITAILSLFFLAYFRDLRVGVASFNLTVILIIIGLFILLGIPFLRFIKRNFGK